MIQKIGDPAPDFQLRDENDQLVTLESLRGKKFVLYFYPKDNTPGCTRESCDFRDQFLLFKEKNILIFGISKDSARSHVSFKTKYNLPFPLLIDTNNDVAAKFGVVNPKSLFGKTVLGVTRSTFYIDEKGILRGIWRNVKVAGHVEEVLHAIH